MCEMVLATKSSTRKILREALDLQRNPNIGRKAVNILLPLSTTYLCETGFSKLNNIKSEKRERLLIVEEDMRMTLSKIRPDIVNICTSLQVYQSH